MRRAVPLVLAAALLAAGCGSAPRSAHHAVSPPPQTAPAASAAPVYSDAHTCWAFHQATTKGVPAGVQMDTLAWLASQTSGAEPALLAELQRFYGAWNAPVPDPGKINRISRAIQHLCR